LASKISKGGGQGKLGQLISNQQLTNKEASATITEASVPSQLQQSQLEASKNEQVTAENDSKQIAENQ